MAIADVTDKSIGELISLSRRGAVVTGGAQGLGAAIVRRLAQAGASVLIGDLQEDLAGKLAADLSQSTGARVIATQLNVTDSASVSAAADLAVAEFGTLDIWVNNAGIFPSAPLLDMTVEMWDAVMAVNLRGIFLGARESARRMIDGKHPGVIVNVASTAGVKGQGPRIAPYVASKHGVVGVTKQMAIELGGHGIRVLGVAPTHCETEGTLAAFKALGNVDMSKDIPALTGNRLGRMGVPDDVGRAVLFCASDLAIFMTGSTLLADGGEAS